MHAVVVKVTVNDAERAQEELQRTVVPRASQTPGFVAGYWTRSENTGLSIVVFETEEAARQMADRVPQLVPEFVTFESAEVREVVAHA